ARFLRDFGDRLEIDDDAAGVGEAFDENRLGLRLQRLAEIFRIGRVDEIAMPAEAFEAQPELRQRAAIEIARGDEAVAGLQQSEKGQELSGVTGGGGDAGASA